MAKASIAACYSELYEGGKGRTTCLYMHSPNNSSECNSPYYIFPHYGTVLGYSPCCYRSGGAPIHQKYFQCRGTEQELSQCDSASYGITLLPWQHYIAVVYCNGTHNFYVNLICNKK